MAHRGRFVTAVFLVTVILFTFFTNTQAGEKGKSTQITHSKFPEKGIESLINGLRSDNTGLQQSVLEIAGKYKLDEMTWPLMSQMKVEKNPGMRILITLALYKIGSERALKAIKDLTYIDQDKKVRRLGRAIANELSVKSHEDYALSNK